jgi:pyruvate carboxylase
MLRKMPLARHGEIAERAFRAAYELGAGTVAVCPWEDRHSVHRLKADESYRIGKVGHPVRSGVEHAVDLQLGVTLLMGEEAIGVPDGRGPRTGMCTLNGQLRPVSVRDWTVDTQIRDAETAKPAQPGHVAARFAGVVTVPVAEGETGEAGQSVATIEAVKMEAAPSTPVAGPLQPLAIGTVQQVEGGDLLLDLAPAGGSA